jgi:multidrug efflux pump subunit AcrA (membrane-fusion protein)
VAVSVAPVLREDLAREWEMAAEFRPWQEIDVNSRIAGYVNTMPVEIGDVLRPGQLIAQLEVPELQQELAQAQAVRKRSELEVVRAESEVTRAESDAADPPAVLRPAGGGGQAETEPDCAAGH